MEKIQENTCCTRSLRPVLQRLELGLFSLQHCQLWPSEEGLSHASIVMPAVQLYKVTIPKLQLRVG